MNPLAIRLGVLVTGLGLLVGAGRPGTGIPGPIAVWHARSGSVAHGPQAGAADLATPSPGLTTPTATSEACHECLDLQVVATSLALFRTQTVAPEGQRPVVRAVMFWMNGCSHCNYVLGQVLPPLQRAYGPQFDILLVEVKTQQDFDLLYQVAAEVGIPRDGVHVPFLIIGEHVLIGSGQIPEELPGLIEDYLAQGGVDYPEVSALAPLLPMAGHAPSGCLPAVPCSQTTRMGATPTPHAGIPSSTDPGDRSFVRPDGFGLAVGIMAGMVIALTYVGVAFLRIPQSKRRRRGTFWERLGIPLLALLGLGVAGYLAYVETQAVPAVCGPVGDCNAVQSSPYARLFGFLPVGVLGVIAYAAILVVWLWGQVGTGCLAACAPRVVFGTSVVGVLFSLYLTYLEPFVIGAVCAWCLTSAMIVTALMLLSLRSALQSKDTLP